jgi:hypothetical protein
MPKEGPTRSFFIQGDVGAVFSVYITNEVHEETTTNKGAVGHFYDFESQQFVASGFKGLLQASIGNTGTASGKIKFPTISDNDHYNIYLRAESHFETELSPALSSNKIIYKVPNINTETNDDGSLKYPSSIYQYIDTTVTIAVLSYNTSVVEPSSTTYVSSRGIVASRSGNIEDTTPSNRKTVSFTISTDGADKNLSILKQPTVNDFYITKTSGTVHIDSHPGSDTAGSGFLIYNYIDVNSVDGLDVGYELVSAVNSSGGAIEPIEAGVYKIVAIKSHEELASLGKQYANNLFPLNVSNVFRIFFNTVSGFPNTEQNSVLTFRGYGPSSSFTTYGAKFSLNNLTNALPLVTNVDTGKLTEFNVTTKTNGAWTSGTNITLDSTAGIKAGNTIYAKGLGLDGSGNQITVASVASSTVIVASAAHDSGYSITDDTQMYFAGSAATATISGDIDFTEISDTNFTLTLDLDKILTLTDSY